MPFSVRLNFFTGKSMKVRVTQACSGRADLLDGLDESLTQIDPGEYRAITHFSGHLQLEMPNNEYAYMTMSDFENGVQSGVIIINS